MIKKNTAVMIGIIGLLAGCASTNTVDISSKPIQIDIARTADPAVVQMNPVNFRVINKENLNSFISELSKTQNNTDPVFIAITTQDYENLSLNLADLRRYIEDQKAIIIYYRNLTTQSLTSNSTSIKPLPSN